MISPAHQKSGNLDAPVKPIRAADLLNDHGDALYVYAIRRVRRPDVAEDLVQETLLAALKGQAAFENRSTVRTWLVAVLRNKIKDYIQEQCARRRREVGQAESDDLFFDRHGRWRIKVRKWPRNPHDCAESSEFKIVLHSCLSRLPVRMAELFVGRVVEKIQTEQLCLDLKVRPETVWTAMHRARLQLRKCLADRWFNEGGTTARADG